MGQYGSDTLTLELDAASSNGAYPLHAVSYEVHHPKYILRVVFINIRSSNCENAITKWQHSLFSVYSNTLWDYTFHNILIHTFT